MIRNATYVISFSSAAYIAATLSVHANWQGLEWGASKAQVIHDATQDLQEVIDPPWLSDEISKSTFSYLEGIYGIGAYQYNFLLSFRNDGLTSVMRATKEAAAKEGKCAALGREVHLSYEGVSQWTLPQTMDFAIWEDNDAVIEWIYDPSKGYCHVHHKLAR